MAGTETAAAGDEEWVRSWTLRFRQFFYEAAHVTVSAWSDNLSPLSLRAL